MIIWSKSVILECQNPPPPPRKNVTQTDPVAECGNNTPFHMMLKSSAEWAKVLCHILSLSKNKCCASTAQVVTGRSGLEPNSEIKPTILDTCRVVLFLKCTEKKNIDIIGKLFKNFSKVFLFFYGFLFEELDGFILRDILSE